MSIILGIESTAHTFGVAVVKNGKILSNVKDIYTTKSGGIIPIEAAKHHREVAGEIYKKSIEISNIKEKEIDAIAFSQGPGLAPCLLEGMKFAKELTLKFGVPIVPVNHCIAHLEIGKTTGAKDPVMLYVSGANTQIIAYASGKYRIFGETLDIGVGNFIDTFARYAGIGFPGGPAIQKLASESSKNYIELPYSVKGMDIALSGILTNLNQKLERINLGSLQSRSHINISDNQKNKIKSVDYNFPLNDINNLKKSERERVNYTLQDLCYSLQETVFAMLVETAERALAHTGKKELLLGGGVACNTRLQEMCRIMCGERIEKTKLFIPENQFLTDNAGMIAYLGEIMFNKKIFEKDLDKIDIKPRERTDDIKVSWK